MEIDYFSLYGFPFMMRKENDGQPYHVTPGDSGGATAWGCTFLTWSAWRASHGESVDIEIFKLLTMNDAKPIYRANFWNAIRCSDMGPLGVAMVDAGALSGPGRAAKFLQTVLNVTVDGEVGPMTIAALNRRNDLSAVNQNFYNERLKFYESLKNDEKFQDGWKRRADDSLALVQDILSHTV